MLPEFTYLQRLIQEINEKRKGFSYIEIDETDMEISFLANKKRLSLGMKSGLSNYAYATHFAEDGSVVEEYMTERSTQIIYECYTKEENGHVSYAYINYVPNGKYPVLGREAGYFTIEASLVYTQTDCYIWYKERDNIT